MVMITVLLFYIHKLKTIVIACNYIFAVINNFTFCPFHFRALMFGNINHTLFTGIKILIHNPYILLCPEWQVILILLW